MVVRRHPSQNSNAPGLKRGMAIIALAATATLAGCSADIRRLEQPSLAGGERSAPPLPSEGIGRRNAGAPPSVDNSGWPNSGAQNPGAQRQQPSYDRVAALPDSSQSGHAPYRNPSVPFDAPKPQKATVTQPATATGRTSAPIVAGQTIEVQQGDSLFSISKRYHVSIAALMDLNGLKSATLKPGQKIALPSNARRPIEKAATPAPTPTAVGVTAVAPATTTVPIATAPIAAAPAAQTAAPIAAPATAPADWTGTHVVQAGESLFGIARNHKVKAEDLQRFNGISEPSKMRQGMSLKVPAGSSTAAITPPATPVVAAAPVTAPVNAAAPVRTAAATPSTGNGQPTATDTPRSASTGGVTILNAPAAAAPATATAPAAQPAPAQPAKIAAAAGAAATTGAATKFRWPAKGNVLASFGKRPDGAHNDGINIAVPAGTDIHAADAGTVAYAGSEIKAYGNLVLIRHEGGWVTAYAHASDLLVKRGDAVTRGQVIAKSGSTGTVEQPQVHFELRQGSKPVDPTPHLEK